MESPRWPRVHRLAGSKHCGQGQRIRVVVIAAGLVIHERAASSSKTALPEPQLPDEVQVIRRCSAITTNAAASVTRTRLGKSYDRAWEPSTSLER